MTGKEYVTLASKTNDGKSTERLTAEITASECFLYPKDFGGVINACLGLSGEVGEFNDMIKKWVFHEKELDIDHAKKELGDIMWYIAQMCKSFDWDLDEILQLNIDKLAKRYPEGFDTERANHRAKEDV